MTRPSSADLRERVVKAMQAVESCRGVAARFVLRRWHPRCRRREKGESLVLGIKNHPLCLTRKRSHEWYPAVTQVEMRTIMVVVTPSIRTTSWLQSNR
jgi:hypothetical protein